VLFGDEQEPTILNGVLIDGNSLVTSKVNVNQWPGAYRHPAGLLLAPYVLDGEAEFTEDPFSVTYTIRDDADWSDGTPITVDDFLHPRALRRGRLTPTRSPRGPATS
jgi:peptide/nickel transport system substrate-binding protein